MIVIILLIVIIKVNYFTIDGTITFDYYKYLIIEVKLTDYTKHYLKELKEQLKERLM